MDKLVKKCFLLMTKCKKSFNDLVIKYIAAKLEIILGVICSLN